MTDLLDFPFAQWEHCLNITMLVFFSYLEYSLIIWAHHWNFFPSKWVLLDLKCLASFSLFLEGWWLLWNSHTLIFTVIIKSKLLKINHLQSTWIHGWTNQLNGGNLLCHMWCNDSIDTLKHVWIRFQAAPCVCHLCIMKDLHDIVFFFFSSSSSLYHIVMVYCLSFRFDRSECDFSWRSFETVDHWSKEFTQSGHETES